MTHPQPQPPLTYPAPPQGQAHVNPGLLPQPVQAAPQAPPTVTIGLERYQELKALEPQPTAPAETPLERHAREYRERMIQGSGGITPAGLRYSPAEVQAAQQAPQPGSQGNQPPPWYQPGMTPLQANAAMAAHQIANNGSIGLRMR